MKLIYLLLVTIASVHHSYSQANAGPNRTISARNSVKIGTSGNSDNCYHWTVVPPGNSPATPDAAETEVTPGKTTAYALAVTGNEFSSLTRDTVTVFRFGIEYFRHRAGKEWKVVAGEPIEFSAIASADCFDWNWDLEDGVPDVWELTGGTIQKGNTMTVPDTDLPEDYDDFGDAYGTLGVSCTDMFGDEHELLSTDAGIGKKVQVFFKRDDYTNPDGVDPNWFYYWQQFIPHNRISTLVYDPALRKYGVTDPSIRKTTIGKLAGMVNNVTGHVGLHTFYETMEHENHHIVLWEGWWPNGYDSTKDSDNDYYPDQWERTDAEAIAYRFIVGINDDYNAPGNSAGFRYEEAKCMTVERALVSGKYDNQDWSYDPTGLYQGKQW